ncbi:MAG: hypothetical protein OMM_12399, partial [Candidatus Magnetoglobus multicellularis str. Araruama]
MLSSKNVIFNNNEIKKRILVVHSGCSSWVHFNIYEINSCFLKRYDNYSVDALIWNKAVTAFDFQTSKTDEINYTHNWREKCEQCINFSQKRFKNFCNNLIYQDNYLTDADRKLVDRFLSSLPEKISQDEYTVMHKSWTPTLQKRYCNEMISNDFKSVFAEQELCPNPFLSFEINRAGN